MSLPQYLQDLVAWLESAPPRNAVVARELGLGAREAMFEVFKRNPGMKFVVVAPRMLARHTWGEQLKKRGIDNVRVASSGSIAIKPGSHAEILREADWVFVDIVTWRRENSLSLRLNEELKDVKRLTVYRHAFDARLKLYLRLAERDLAGPTS